MAINQRKGQIVSSIGEVASHDVVRSYLDQAKVLRLVPTIMPRTGPASFGPYPGNHDGLGLIQIALSKQTVEGGGNCKTIRMDPSGFWALLYSMRARAKQ
jgi:hypothetical protein